MITSDRNVAFRPSRIVQSMPQRPHAEIAGAGFAGLVAAIALSDRGWTVRLHERASELRALGAGIFV